MEPLTRRLHGFDALRGVAAMAVVLYHMNGRLGLSFLCPHGYLAVDFFFLLSGFVLFRAFGEKLERGDLGVVRFMWLRGIRLYPLIALGLVICAAVEIGRPQIADQQRHAADVFVALALGGAMIPILWSTTLEHVVFPLNGPMWSLFLEGAANAVFSRVNLRGAVGAALIVGCGAVLVVGVVNRGDADVGATPETFPLGLARVGFSFTAGVWLAARAPAPLRVPFAAPALALIAMLAAPIFGAWNSAYDIVSVLVLAPAVVWLSAPVQFGGWAARVGAWLGEMSYPLYALHYPAVRVIAVGSAALHLTTFSKLGVAIAAAVALALGASAAHRFFDAPLRAALLSRLSRRDDPGLSKDYEIALSGTQRPRT